MNTFAVIWMVDPFSAPPWCKNSSIYLAFALFPARRKLSHCFLQLCPSFLGKTNKKNKLNKDGKDHNKDNKDKNKKRKHLIPETDGGVRGGDSDKCATKNSLLEEKKDDGRPTKTHPIQPLKMEINYLPSAKTSLYANLLSVAPLDFNCTVQRNVQLRIKKSPMVALQMQRGNIVQGTVEMVASDVPS